MDKSVFRSFQYHWDNEITRYWGVSSERKLINSAFGIVFSKEWPNIFSSFRATGIDDDIDKC